MKDEIREKIIEVLRQIYDPEIPIISIYDLGLVRDIKIDDKSIFIRLIFTAKQGCTLAELIGVQVKYRLMRDFPDYKIDVKVDFNEEWNISYLTEEGVAILKDAYGEEVLNVLADSKKIENLIPKPMRIDNFDPKEYMRRKVEERYRMFKKWYESHKIV